MVPSRLSLIILAVQKRINSSAVMENSEFRNCKSKKVCFLAQEQNLGDGVISKDGINKLCDNILIKILSFLSIKEAIRTSVVSKRWKQLWQLFSGCLSFSPASTGINFYHGSNLDLIKMKSESPRFVGCINKVLNSHQGSNIDELRVCFVLDKDLGSYVDKWIDFALKKKVKKIELFNFWSSTMASRLSCYSLSQETFSSTTSSLTCLSMESLGVSDEIMEYILSNCPLLESLKVTHSPHLRDPKFVGSSLRLKHLQIALCEFVQSIEVCAPNLVSFKYIGNEIPLHIRYVPKLQELHYFNPWNSYPRNYNIPLAFSQLSNYYLPQLVTLTLIMPFQRVKSNKLTIFFFASLLCFLYFNTHKTNFLSCKFHITVENAG